MQNDARQLPRKAHGVRKRLTVKVLVIERDADFAEARRPTCGASQLAQLWTGAPRPQKASTRWRCC